MCNSRVVFRVRVNLESFAGATPSTDWLLALSDANLLQCAKLALLNCIH